MQKFRYIFWKKCFLKIRKMTNKNWSPSLIFIKKIRKIPQIFNTEKWLKIRKFFVSFLSGSSQELTSLMLWKFEWKQVAIFFFANSAVSYTTAKNQWGKATRQLWISFGSIQKKQKPGGHLWNANSRKAELEIMRFDNNHRCLFCSCTLCWRLWLFSEIR